MRALLAQTLAVGVFASLALSTAARAADAALDLSGSAAATSDYRFRGISRSDNGPAVQGGLNAAHRSGAYAGVWASTLAGSGRIGGSDFELDLFGGWRLPLGNGSLDLGGIGYVFPGADAPASFAEARTRLSGSIGPVGLTAGAAYAWKQAALGNWSNHPASRAGARGDNLYLWGDADVALLGTPLTARAHLGRSSGNPGLGPGGTSLAPTGRAWDWLLGLDYVQGALTFGVAYVDTDIGRDSAGRRRLQPQFSASGAPISSGRVVLSVTAGF